jgi:Rho GTPase-activating protein 17
MMKFTNSHNLRHSHLFLFLLFITFRGSKADKNDDLQHIERQVDKYREVLQTISKKVSPPGLDVARDKRIKKVHEYILGQALDESSKELPDGIFKKILDDCGK